MGKFIFNFGFFIFFIFYSACYGQTWIKSFNGPGNTDDKAYAITIDRVGNIYITGYITNTSNNTDMCLIKYNSNGVQQWVKTYNGPANSEDKTYAITIDNLNNVIITGFSTAFGSMADITTIKYNPSGTQQWLQRYPAPLNGDDKAYAIAVDDSNNVYVAGYITSAGADYIIIKYNSSGVPQWLRAYNGPGNEDDKAYAITIDEADNIYITGCSTGIESGFDYATIKYSRTGQQQWVARYDGIGSSDDIAKDMVIAGGNQIYVTGSSRSDTSAGSEDYLTIRYDATNGDTLWTKRYNGPGEADDKAYAITVDNVNNIYITGYSTGLNSSFDYTTIKYTNTGTQSWVARYNGTGNSQDIAYDVCTPYSKNYVFVTGSSRNNSSQGSEDIVTIKYNIETGDTVQVSRYDGPGKGEDAAMQIAVDTSNNIFVAGYIKTTSNNFDWVTMKFFRGDLIKVNNISIEVPKNYALFQNYPNPFNPSTVIRFDVLKAVNVKITVYDVLGKQMAVLVNEYMRTGTYEVSLTAHDLSSGIYFYEMTAGDFRDVKKMILVK